jgi:hypothetical protein
MTIEEYAATLPITTNVPDRVELGLSYMNEHYGDLMQRLADDDPPDKPDKDHAP